MPTLYEMQYDERPSRVFTLTPEELAERQRFHRNILEMGLAAQGIGPDHPNRPSDATLARWWPLTKEMA